MAMHEFREVIDVPDVWYVENDKLTRIYHAMASAAYAEIEAFYAEERAKG